MTDPKKIQSIPGIAHDIRQMLMVITGRAGLLLEQVPDPVLRRHLQAMEMAATDAGAMLGRLPGMGVPIPQDSRAELLLVARESCRLILPPGGQDWAAPDQDMTLGSWSADLQIPAGLQASLPDQILREVINNLLTNALEVMPSGGRIVLTGSAVAERIQLLVQDSGPGVPPEHTEQIFEPGFTTSGKSGRGLGLAGCRDLLRQFDGNLQLMSTSDSGAVFVLDLPLAEGPSPGNPETAADQAIGLLEPGEILVVDDEPAVQDMLADVLTELGWRPTVAMTADQALEYFSPGRFPVALVDQSLPGLSGLELASKLRKMDSRMVLVLVTGWGNEDIMARATASGIDFTDEKPLAVGKIRSILEQAGALLRKRDEEREES